MATSATPVQPIVPTQPNTTAAPGNMPKSDNNTPTNEDVDNHDNYINVHYVDSSNFYSVYGIVTLICVILLMWFFVRTTMDNTDCMGGMKCSKCKKKCNGTCRCGCHYCGLYMHGKQHLLRHDNRDPVVNVCSKCGKQCYGKCNCKCPHCIMHKREGMFPFEDASVRAYFPEFSEFKPTPVIKTPPDENKPSNVKYATYGDVPIVFYELPSDAYHAPDWYDGNKALYVPNMRTSFKKVNTPVERLFWNE
jgi:hypothetical protein